MDLSDLRFAWRIWTRHPMTLAVTTLSLGLGVGAICPWLALETARNLNPGNIIGSEIGEIHRAGQTLVDRNSIE